MNGMMNEELGCYRRRLEKSPHTLNYLVRIADGSQNEMIKEN
jgi:hypothetical protein